MKKVFFISMLAVATIVACGKEEEETTPQVQEPETAEGQTVSEQITIMKSDETGIVIRIGEGEEARDSIIPLTVPYFAPSVIKGQCSRFYRVHLRTCSGPPCSTTNSLCLRYV